MSTVSVAGCEQSGDSGTPTEKQTDSPTTQTTGDQTTGEATTVPEDTSSAPGIRFDGGDREAFQRALSRLAEGEASELTIAEGTYRFDAPDPEQAATPFFTLQEATDVVIEGNDATIVFENPLLGGIGFQGGSGITVQNLTFDYDPLPFTQGVIRGVSPDERRVRLEIDAGFPPLDHDMFDAALHVSGSVLRDDNHFLSLLREGQKNALLRFSDIIPRSDKEYDLILTEPSTLEGVEAGRKLVIGVRNAGMLGATRTDDFRLESVSIRAAPGMALNAEQCNAAEIVDVTVAPPPNSDRAMGVNADGLHLSAAEIGPTIRDCQIARHRDDSIVVNAGMITIQGLTDPRTVVLDPHGKIPIQAGDILKSIRPDGTSIGTLPAVASVQYHQEYSADWVLQWPEAIEFSEPVADELEPGYLLANQSRSNAGFEITGNTIRETTANGIRLAARDGIVENNEIDGTGWRGIALRCDAGGWDSLARWTSEVTIRNNRIRNPGLAGYVRDGPTAIDIRYNPGGDDTSVGRPHRNLQIQENVMEHGAYLGVYLDAASRVEVSGNTLADLNHYPLPDGGGFGIALENVGPVSLRENRVTGPSERLYQFGWQVDTDPLTVVDNELAIDESVTDPEVVEWQPIILDFDRTIQPEGGHLHLAFHCSELSLIDASGSALHTVNLGGREMPVEFGEGVYDVERQDGATWRWFGGEGEQAVLLFASSDLSAASTLEISGHPYEDGISAALRRDGTKIDAVTFGSRDESDIYEFSLGS